MPRIHTWRVVAVMTDIQALWNWPDKQLPRQPMRLVINSRRRRAYRHSTISVNRNRPLPNPTAITTVRQVSVESLDDRLDAPAEPIELGCFVDDRVVVS